MRRVAFYAPMKSPRNPVPSGDREMARNLMTVIHEAGLEVSLASELRIYDRTGDPALQSGLRASARSEVDRLTEELPQDTALWITYHNYYKAPDLIGPAICRARNIPYVQVESTRATSRLDGAWSGFARDAHTACDAAEVIFYLTQNDLITLQRERFGDQALVHLPPFLPRTGLPPAGPRNGPMLCAGMMREGDKLASYRIIAETLAHLGGDWRLEIAGDGPARARVEDLMAPYGDKVRFLGELDPARMQAAYGRAALFLWPGVNEAFGMVYLEAQAAGLPVVAQDRPGVRDVLLSGHYPAPDAGPPALASMIRRLLADPDTRLARGAAARKMIERDHLLPAATNIFAAAVAPLLETQP
ncbi:Glycosyltransferase involved in cell wall bisynthesis [Cribrihabitans marinus]|uniref:Glycosyltransferase involved in cell wall bisynthesis n=1 Tax=Cribrihabitans marinus TaxID=1227549 RepID=A0A1H6S9M4_9RHOB|nr:glycosyltransferase family 4 protein [Cribrihabitans marinus]GGH23720.1 glycosyl transferase [Cribrihabitans marinus]SEI64808.1 Glycosyltransferase involved in cell wall bisynthesis [Cribrihabitans marinus]